MTLADCCRPLFACRMIHRSSPAVVVLERPPPIFTCGLERFQSTQSDTFVDAELCRYTGDSTPLFQLSDFLPCVKSSRTSFGYTALDLCKSEADKNKLIGACSPFIQGNTIIPDSKSTKNDKLVILCSNLDEKQKEKLQKCAQLLKADIVDEFKSEVTHVITSCDNMGNCTRTMKILLGILTGKWVMNFQWIEVCLEYKQKVDEEVFEVQGTRNQPNTQGPKRGRQNYEQKCPPLFDGFFFYLHGTFAAPTPTREDLSNLIHLGGGKLLSREPKQDTIDAYMIPYHAAESPLEDTSHIILYQEKPPKERHIHSGHICTSQVMWLVTCIRLPSEAEEENCDLIVLDDMMNDVTSEISQMFTMGSHHKNTA
ncbi:BRCA1-associated RING domain protein 1 [Trichonephila clavipes]|nr:BRCA1-associated RING domain protein 1 [Trichonephila clavipes]